MATIPSHDLFVDVFVYIGAMRSQAGDWSLVLARDYMARHASVTAGRERSVKWSMVLSS